jgi:hypothetical protein
VEDIGDATVHVTDEDASDGQVIVMQVVDPFVQWHVATGTLSNHRHAQIDGLVFTKQISVYV